MTGRELKFVKKKKPKTNKRYKKNNCERKKQFAVAGCGLVNCKNKKLLNTNFSSPFALHTKIKI